MKKEPRTPHGADGDVSRLSRIALFLMPTLAALGPFLSLTPGSPGAPYAYRVLIAVAAAPALLNLVRARGSGIFTRTLLFTTLAFIVWGTMALGWTPNTGRGSRQLVGILIGILGCWVAIGLAGHHSRGRQALRRGFVLAATTLSAVGVWQYVTGNNMWNLVGQPFNFDGNPLIGTFINPNNFAAFLLGCLGPILAITIAGKWRDRMIGLALIGVIAWILMNTESRTGVFGLALICGVGCVIVGIKLPKSQTPLFMAFLGMLAVLALNMGKVARLLGGVDADSSASDDLRVQLSKAAWRYFIESWGIGIGPAGFEPTLENDSSAQVIRILPPHNTFLEMAAEYGAPTIVPFLALMAALTFAAIKRLPSHSKELTAQRVELLACVIAIIAGGLVASSLIADPSWWLLIAYSILLARRDEDPEGTDQGSEGADPDLRRSSRTAAKASYRTHTNQMATKHTAKAAS